MNVVVWLIAPTYLSRYAYNDQIDERVNNMWNVHRNRVDNGLGATYSNSGFHQHKPKEWNFNKDGHFVNVKNLITGVMPHTMFDNEYIRWHEHYEKYSNFFCDIDDVEMHETDELERYKPHKPLKKHTVGTTSVIPRQDNDE